MCATAIECFLNYIDLGLRMGGGIGDSSPRVSFKFDNKGKYFVKIIWDVVFHIVVNLILMNIFFGVIVDTFNELRDQKDKKAEDEANKCFMCNRDRFDNKYEEDFNYHRTTQHKISNYTYFITYLLNKNFQEYNRAELYAWQQINLRNLDWLPSRGEEEKEEEKDK